MAKFEISETLRSYILENHHEAALERGLKTLAYQATAWAITSQQNPENYFSRTRSRTVSKLPAWFETTVIRLYNDNLSHAVQIIEHFRSNLPQGIAGSMTGQAAREYVQQAIINSEF